MKFSVLETILNGNRKADSIVHTKSSKLFVDDSQNLLVITIYMIQF